MKISLGKVAVLLAAWAFGIAPAVRAQGDRPNAVPEWRTDARVARSLHMDLLGRPPLAAERARSVGRPVAEVVDDLLATREFWQRWFEEQLYYFLLVGNFRPQSERVLAIPDELAAGKLDPRVAIHRVALSTSFDQRNPGADTFVTVVMEQLTGLEVQKNTRELDIGKKVYDGNPGRFLGNDGSSQADVVRIAVESKAFAKHFVGREYERLVHKRPDSAEWNQAAGEFGRDPNAYRALVRRWVLSDAYRARVEARVPVSNRLFVRGLFVDLMDRLPTDEESEPMRQALDGLSDPAPLRSVLVRMMLDSGKVALPKRESIRDPAAWIGGEFERLFGRPPSDVESAAFVAGWNEPHCRVQTILCALLSSAEYQSY